MRSTGRLVEWRQAFAAGGASHLTRMTMQRARSRWTAIEHGLPRDIRIGSGARVIGGQYIVCGDHFSAGSRARIECIDRYLGEIYTPTLRFGSGVRLNDDVHIGCVDQIDIGDDVLIGSKVLIIDHNHGRYDNRSGEVDSPRVAPRNRGLSADPIRIGARVWLGEQVVILPGSQVDDGSVVGAGAVVSGEHIGACVLVGNPARPVRMWSDKDRTWRPVTKELFE